MSQLTEEQIKYALSRNDVPWKEFKTREDVVEYMQHLLTQPPAWGELYNQCYWESGGDTEKAAKTFIRAFIKREVEPLLEGSEPYVHIEEINSVIARFSE